MLFSISSCPSLVISRKTLRLTFLASHLRATAIVLQKHHRTHWHPASGKFTSIMGACNLERREPVRLSDISKFPITSHLCAVSFSALWNIPITTNYLVAPAQSRPDRGEVLPVRNYLPDQTACPTLSALLPTSCQSQCCPLL